jgi:hypothetical protein
MGRPVAFAGAAPDETLAGHRYGEAYRRIGVRDPVYAYEPVGAAYYYAQRLKSDALVLVCDFGGGTSDFSLIRFERRGTRVSATPIGHAGVAVAGDNFGERLRAEGEWVYPVQPLTAPAADVAADDDSCAMAPFGCSQRGRERQSRVLRRTGT